VLVFIIPTRAEALLSPLVGLIDDPAVWRIEGGEAKVALPVSTDRPDQSRPVEISQRLDQQTQEIFTRIDLIPQIHGGQVYPNAAHLPGRLRPVFQF